MGAPTPDIRIQSSRTLLEYGFRFFETHELFKKDREMVKNIVGSENFIEIYVNASLAECEKLSLIHI